MVKEYVLSGEDFSVAGEASSNFKALLKKLGIPADTIRRVSIAMYEAEINTIVHGGGGTCLAEIESNRIKITFSDHGPGIPDINLAMREGFSTASDRVRELGFGAGMGLPNIKKYTDDMIINSKPGEGTTVTIIINL
ncbi:MAG: ATP-binding protein [Firmicutes bacterium]|nr:ATP-binding protein [Bacillota bacterium]